MVTSQGHDEATRRDDQGSPDQGLHDSVGAWAKKLYLASRGLMESILREYDLGPTQFYVLYQLTNNGPIRQRDLGHILNVERATLSGLVATLVRKGLVTQEADSVDQRQRMLRISEAGQALWRDLPDPVAVIQAVAFEGADADELAVARRVLQDATRRLSELVAK